MSTLNIQVGSITQPGSTGNLVTNLPANFDPKALHLFAVVRTGNGGGSAHLVYGEGFATYRGSVVQQCCGAITAEDNIGTADTYDMWGTDAILKLTNGADATIDAEIDFVSFATGASSSFTLNFVNLHTTASIVINYVVFGGSGVEDALVSSFTTQTTPSTQDVTVTSGFGQPSLIFFGRITTTMDGTFKNRGDFSHGFGVKDGALMGRGVGVFSTDAATTEATGQRISNNSAMYSGLNLGQEIDFRLSAGSWPTDGFEVTYASGGQDFAEAVHYMAIRFASDVTIVHGEGSAPTSGGLPVVQTLASSGTPKLLYIMSARTATANATDTTSADCMQFGVGAVDGAGNERTAGGYDDDGQATASVAGTYQSNAKAIQYWAPSTNALSSEADGQVNGSNFELSWNDIDAAAFKYQWFTIGVASSESHSGASSVAGGGGSEATATKGGAGASSGAGGGGLDLSDVKGATSGSAVVGGGSVATVAAKDTYDRSGTSSVSDGGAASATCSKGGQGASTSSGAGATSASAAKGGTGTSDVSGGGLTAGTGFEGAVQPGAVSGGGSVESLGAKNARGTSSVSGAGAMSATATTEESHAGSSACSGGGSSSGSGRKDTSAESSSSAAGFVATSSMRTVTGVSSVSAGGELASESSAGKTTISIVSGGGLLVSVGSSVQPAAPPVTTRTSAGGSGSPTRTSGGSGPTRSGGGGASRAGVVGGGRTHAGSSSGGSGTILSDG